MPRFLQSGARFSIISTILVRIRDKGVAVLAVNIGTVISFIALTLLYKRSLIVALSDIHSLAI